MTHIHYVESDRRHDSSFIIDVPIGYHWLLVITKTPARFWVNGKLKEYPAHSAVLYRPHQKIYYSACTDQFVNDWIRFETNEPYITESPLALGVPFPLNDPDYIDKLFKLLVIEHNDEQLYKASSISSLLRILFNKLLESHFHDNITSKHYKLLRLRNAIQSNPGEQWTVEKMAKQVMISPGYLQNLYKKTFGVSCMEEVINSRIKLAKEYLSHSSQSIAEIAEQCGYQNVEHFCRQFKKITQKTPRQYQKLEN